MFVDWANAKLFFDCLSLPHPTTFSQSRITSACNSSLGNRFTVCLNLRKQLMPLFVLFTYSTHISCKNTRLGELNVYIGVQRVCQPHLECVCAYVHHIVLQEDFWLHDAGMQNVEVVLWCFSNSRLMHVSSLFFSTERIDCLYKAMIARFLSRALAKKARWIDIVGALCLFGICST